MYIYKITVLPINAVYIGLDTKPSYKMSRWNTHCQEAMGTRNSKLHNAIRTHGIENCRVEVLQDNVETIGKLALLEISYIEKHDSYKNGLNSSLGGDGLGKANFASLSDDEIKQIKEVLGNRLTEYNTKIKWAGTTAEQRKELTQHLHNEVVYAKKAATLKRYYASNPDQKSKKYEAIKAWRDQNKDELRKICAAASDAAAKKNRKKLQVAQPDGSTVTYNSYEEFNKLTGQSASYVLKKTDAGLSHNGYKAWRV